MEKDAELFLTMYGSQACRPLITLTPSSVAPNGMFLFISPSLPPSISICCSAPGRAKHFLYTTASLYQQEGRQGLEIKYQQWKSRERATTAESSGHNNKETREDQILV